MTTEEFYELAANAVKRKRFTQARDYFIKCLEKDPEFVEARKGLRAVAINQFDGKEMSALLSGFPILLQMLLAKVKKNNDQGLILGEQFLYKNPKHKWTLKQMISFAEGKEYMATLCHLHTVLADLCPEDADIVVEAADFLSDEGSVDNFEKAVGLMTQLCNVYPEDTDLSTDRNRIEAKRVVRKLENAQNQSDVLKDKDAAKNMEEESQQIKTADDLENAILRARSRDEKELTARSKEVLADLLLRKGEVLEAIEYFQASIELDPNNQSIYARLGDAKFKL
jgi:tetratricopeptide (TPR) repeat protein